MYFFWVGSFFLNELGSPSVEVRCGAFLGVRGGVLLRMCVVVSRDVLEKLSGSGKACFGQPVTFFWRRNCVVFDALLAKRSKCPGSGIFRNTGIVPQRGNGYSAWWRSADEVEQFFTWWQSSDAVIDRGEGGHEQTPPLWALPNLMVPAGDRKIPPQKLQSSIKKGWLFGPRVNFCSFLLYFDDQYWFRTIFLDHAEATDGLFCFFWYP